MNDWLAGQLILPRSVFGRIFFCVASYFTHWFTLHIKPHSPQVVRVPQPNTACCSHIEPNTNRMSSEWKFPTKSWGEAPCRYGTLFYRSKYKDVRLFNSFCHVQSPVVTYISVVCFWIIQGERPTFTYQLTNLGLDLQTDRTRFHLVKTNFFLFTKK